MDIVITELLVIVITAYYVDRSSLLLTLLVWTLVGFS